MTPEVFEREMVRLRAAYGDKGYPDDRVKLIWNAVKKMPDVWMENTVNRFIGNMRNSPVLEDFNQRVEAFNNQYVGSAPNDRRGPQIQAYVYCDYCHSRISFLWQGYSTELDDKHRGPCCKL